jgi:hypothetical protein
VDTRSTWAIVKAILMALAFPCLETEKKGGRKEVKEVEFKG